MKTRHIIYLFSSIVMNVLAACSTSKPIILACLAGIAFASGGFMEGFAAYYDELQQMANPRVRRRA